MRIKYSSVQVHLNDEEASWRTPPDRGKTEAWYVVEAEPGAKSTLGCGTASMNLPYGKQSLQGHEDVLHVINPEQATAYISPLAPFTP